MDTATTIDPQTPSALIPEHSGDGLEVISIAKSYDKRAVLSDISLSIFVGTIVAAYSTLFVAVPLYALLRERETPIKESDARVLAARAKAGVPA